MVKLILALALGFLSLSLNIATAHASKRGNHSSVQRTARSVTLTFADNIVCVANDTGHAVCMAFDTHLAPRMAHSVTNHRNMHTRAHRDSGCRNHTYSVLSRSDMNYIMGDAIRDLRNAHRPIL